VQGELVGPACHDQLFAELSTGRPHIPRGAGLSYCNASAGSGVRSVSTLRFNRVLDFDAEAGTVVVEPGLRVGELLRFALERGWVPPMLPGHPMISVGGSVAFNVHGKSHYHEGNFIDCLERIVLFHPDHGQISCGPSEEPGLFELTVGGFGLTGFITRIQIRLRRSRGAALRRQRVPVRNLTEAVQLMDAHCDKVDALCSWNDLNRRGEAFGRGVVYLERLSSEPASRTGRFRRLNPETRGRLRVNAFSPLVAKAFTRVCGALESRREKDSLVDLEAGSFLINGKEIYFQLFGATGLREYQLLVPRASWETVVAELDGILGRSGLPVTLGSLKLFRGETKLLNFAGSGVCLALDVPATPDALRLFERLDALVLEAGGIVNLSKDSRLSGAFLRRAFPEYDSFRQRLSAYDPKRRFDSALRRRIGV
jgi:decaprenylphospho-beta-D-ribofuranose 2-oxidase